MFQAKKWQLILFCTLCSMQSSAYQKNQISSAAAKAVCLVNTGTIAKAIAGQRWVYLLCHSTSAVAKTACPVSTGVVPEAIAGQRSVSTRCVTVSNRSLCSFCTQTRLARRFLQQRLVRVISLRPFAESGHSAVNPNFVSVCCFFGSRFISTWYWRRHFLSIFRRFSFLLFLRRIISALG